MSGYINVVVSIKDRELARYSFRKTEITVGRSSDADIVLDNAGVSREHACISRDETGVFVADLESNNGTFHNGVAISTSSVSPGDNLRIGKFSLAVTTGAEPLAEKASVNPQAPAQAGMQGDTSDASADVRVKSEAAALGPDHTVVVSSKEKIKVLQEASRPATEAPAAARESSALWPFIAGAVVGSLLTWFLL